MAIQQFIYAGEKVVVQLDNVLFWGYVVDCEVYEDESLSFADRGTVINTYYSYDVLLQETLDVADEAWARSYDLIGGTFRFEDVIPVTD